MLALPMNFFDFVFSSQQASAARERFLEKYGRNYCDFLRRLPLYCGVRLRPEADTRQYQLTVQLQQASEVHELTPQIWKEMFAANPLRSDLHDLARQLAYPIA